MKITSIPQIYRNLAAGRKFCRSAEVWLADWLSQLKLDFIRDWIKDDQVPLSSYSREQRIRMAMVELGPTFVVGQVPSLRPT